METIPVIKLNSIDAPAKANDKWWSDKEDRILANSLITVAKAIDDRQKTRSMKNLRNARLYSNMELSTLSAYSTMPKASMSRNKIKLNVCKSAVNTLAAKIAKNKPRPLFLTEDGNFNEQRRAELLTQYVTGQFNQAKTYAEGQKAFVDGAVFGTGAIKIYRTDKEVKTERVLIDEILVDDVDGVYGTPRSLFQRKYVHKEVLIEQFSKYETEIQNAFDNLRKVGDSAMGVSEMIYVVEGWHLPSGNGDDGLHAIAIEGATLFQEKYEKDYFPFAFFRWETPTLGFYGNSAIEELEGIQIEINKTLMDLSMSSHLFAVPRIFMQLGSNVTKALNNDIGAIYNYQGSAPIFSTPSAQAPDVYNHLWQLYSKAFEIIGVSQLSATSRKPAGLDSGVALREFSDIETERFVLVGQRYEDFFMEIARQMIDQTRDMMKAESGKVKIQGAKFVKKIDWKDVDLEEDKYVMQVFPTSLLPHTPAGRLQTVNELTEAGFIDKDKALQLLDFPDVQEFTSLATADIDNTKRLIGRMLHEGQYEPPDPLMNLQLAVKMSQQAYLKAKCDNAPEDRLEFLRQFIEEALDKLVPKDEPAPAQQVQAPTAPPPMTNPNMMPVEPQLPIQPQAPIQ